MRLVDGANPRTFLSLRMGVVWIFRSKQSISALTSPSPGIFTASGSLGAGAGAFGVSGVGGGGVGAGDGVGAASGGFGIFGCGLRDSEGFPQAISIPMQSERIRRDRFLSKLKSTSKVILWFNDS